MLIRLLTNVYKNLVENRNIFMAKKALLCVVGRTELLENRKKMVRTSRTLRLLAFVSLHRHNQHFYEIVNPSIFLKRSSILNHVKITLFDFFWSSKHSRCIYSNEHTWVIQRLLCLCITL